MSHCLCGVCDKCKERARITIELIKAAKEFGKKHNCSPLVFFQVLEETRRRKAESAVG